MQLMPKTLISTIGALYLKNSKSVFFHPQPCEALDSLVQLLMTGFVCVQKIIIFYFNEGVNPFPTY